LAWSGRDTRHVLTVHSNGNIILWDLKQTQVTGSTTTPKRLAVLEEPGVPQSRCCFLPHENALVKEHQPNVLTTCFVTGSHRNTKVTIWSSFTQDELPTKLQVLQLQDPSPSYVLDLCFGPAPQDASPPSCFLLLADRHEGKLLAIHVASQWNARQKALCVGSDYVVPFVLKHPVFSWSVVCSPTQDISEDDIPESAAGLIFDMKLFAYQSKVVQCLTLTSYMCLPPEHGFNPNTTIGVRVEPLPSGGASGVGAGAGFDEMIPSPDVNSLEPTYDEEYDLEEDDLDDDDDDDVVEEEEQRGPPPPSALPTPDDTMQNPFANWLGAIATTNSEDMPMPPPPPPSTPATGFISPKATMNLPPGLGGGLGGVPLAPVLAVVPDGGRSVSASSTSSSQQQQPLLSPMDLLTSGGDVNGSATANANVNANGSNNNANNKPPANNTNTTKGAPRAATPNKNKGKPKKSRSKSPKGKKNKSNNNNSNVNNPFPEGTKISILKRDKSPPRPTQAIATATPDPVIVSSSDPVIVPPPTPTSTITMMDPNLLEAALVKVLSQELAKHEQQQQKQKPPVVNVESEITKAVELAMTAQFVPAVDKVLQESLASFGRPLKASMDQLGQQGVSVKAEDLQSALAEHLETPLKAAMANAMRTVLVPALESMTSQVLQHVKMGMPPPPPDQTKVLEILTQQLAAMNTKLDGMSKELKVLRTTPSGGGNPNNPPSVAQQQQPPPQRPPPQMEIIRNEINTLLQQRNYEAAFTKALSASTADMAVYACSRADLANVMGVNPPALSQPILLCLMQQLGAALVVSSNASDLQTELLWLQEIALTLNPTDPNIRRHVPSVLQQLVSSINQKMAEGNMQLRRPLHMLLQVIRGMQMG
jgi:enhancer of mRNA-decapping protein 4